MRKRRRKQSKSNPNKPSNKKSEVNARQIFLYTLAVGVAGGAAYLTYDYFKKKKANAQLPSDVSDRIIINNNLPASYTSTNVSTSTKSTSTSADTFPLKQGSRGPRVTMLQQALDSILGAGTMQKKYGGIDGIFGSLTAAALREAQLPEVIDEKTFNTLTQGALPANTLMENPSEIALALFRAAQSKLQYNVIAILRQIKSVDQYTAVNDAYKKYGLISKTIVTDLLDFVFKYNETAKQQIRDEFLRIGLKVDDSGRWSLSGFGQYKDIITLRGTYVVDSQNNRIPVRANTILGDPVKVANGMTWFRSIDNSILQVPTQDVKNT